MHRVLPYQIKAKHAAHKSGDAKAADAKKVDHKTADAKKVDTTKAADATKDDASKMADAKKAAAHKTAALLASKKIDHAAEEKKDMKKAALKVAKKMAEHNVRRWSVSSMRL